MNKPRILLLFSGGTIAMMENSKNDNALAPVDKNPVFHTVIEQLRERYHVDTAFITNIDSANIQIEHWQSIVQNIVGQYDHYDGFVVAHGTDTMSFSASAVSFALGEIGKPVVFTGAQLPISNLRSDAKLNLVNAFEVATMDLGEVVIVFGNYILRANRSTKVSERHFDAYKSPKFQPLGDITTTISLRGIQKGRRDFKPEPKLNFSDKVSIYTIHPAVTHEFFDVLIDSGVAGIVVTAVGAGNIPTGESTLSNSISRAVKKNIPVIITTQCSEGRIDLFTYETGRASLDAGAISSKDMTIEAATTKLMWALGQTRQMAEIKKLMLTDLVGELSN